MRSLDSALVELRQRQSNSLQLLSLDDLGAIDQLYTEILTLLFRQHFYLSPPMQRSPALYLLRDITREYRTFLTYLTDRTNGSG